jgi:DNA-binding CsgD family transcriptional regulator
MKKEDPALVIFADVVGSRRDPAGSATWLRRVVAELNEACGDRRLAPFGFTQGDELQGLLTADSDPFDVVLRTALSADARPTRWGIVIGRIDPGEGPAPERTGPAFIAARAAIEQARETHERFVMVTGNEQLDELLADLTPAFAELIEAMTPRQRQVARLAVIDNLRQSEVADRLAVRRATVSVAFSRARVHPLKRLLSGIRNVYGSASGTGKPADDRSTSQAMALVVSAHPEAADR